MEVHTIPVPVGWSVEQAWEAVSRGAWLPRWTLAGWANVLVDGDSYRVLPAEGE
jgi:hypothetical protein